MKQIKYILAIISIISLFACEDDLNPYNEETNRLNFVFETRTKEDTLISRTFVYDLESKVLDTVWLKVSTMGYVVNENRKFALEQVVKGEDPQAEAGIHYVDFNDPLVKDLYMIPAGQNEAIVPVILQRDTSLARREFALRIRIAENENFQSGYPDSQEKIIKIADILQEPKLWYPMGTYYFAGEYGIEKHKFMIRATAGMGIKINDEFFESLVGGKVDMSLTNYWFGFFTRKLAEENAERKKQGLDVLREAPNPVLWWLPGPEVKFTQYVL